MNKIIKHIRNFFLIVIATLIFCVIMEQVIDEAMAEYKTDPKTGEKFRVETRCANKMLTYDQCESVLAPQKEYTIKDMIRNNCTPPVSLGLTSMCKDYKPE